MKILVTGANGFIGQRLSLYLIEHGHHVVGLSLQSPLNPSLKFKGFYQQDITKPFLLKDHFDYVIHLAAYNITHVGNQDQSLYNAHNVEGTKHLLRAVRTNKFIYLSTAKVYKNEGQPLLESSPLLPQGAYAQSKLKAEEECRSFLKEKALVILRSVNVLGWGQAPKAVLPVFFQKAKHNQALDIINVAQMPMQFIYVDDLIDAIGTIIGHENVSGVFNVVHEETVTLEELARRVIQIMHSTSDLNIIKNSSEILFSPVNAGKIYQQLNWKAKTGLTRILELYKDEYAKIV